MVAEAPPMIRGSEQSIISAALVFIVALCVLKLKICAGTCDSVNSTLHEEAGSVGSGEPELCLMCRHVGFFMGGGGVFLLVLGSEPPSFSLVLVLPSFHEVQTLLFLNASCSGPLGPEQSTRLLFDRTMVAFCVCLDSEEFLSEVDVLFLTPNAVQASNSLLVCP